MITSLFQKPIEVLSLNGSSRSFGYVILPVKMQFIVWILFRHKFPEKASRVKNFCSQPFRHWPAAVAASKVHAEGKEKKTKKALMSHANHCIVKHGLFSVISWLI